MNKIVWERKKFLLEMKYIFHLFKSFRENPADALRSVIAPYKPRSFMIMSRSQLLLKCHQMVKGNALVLT